MKVFLGWSGDLSRQLADAFHNWLKNVVQAIEPFLSTRDIDKGARWHTLLTGTLQDTSYGVFFLTRLNKSNPWMHFEAGALSKEIGQSKICPFLFDVRESELEGPFVYFQATRFDQDDIFELLKSINSNLEKPLPDQVLKESFNTHWPKLEKRLNELETTLEKDNQLEKSYYDPLTLEEYRDIFTKIIQRDGIISVYGLRDIFSDRQHALTVIRNEIDTEGKEIVIIGSSLKGLIGVGGDSAGEQNLMRISLIDALKRGVKVKALLTNPVVAHHRSKQEGRERGEIETEIIDNLIYFTKERKDNKDIARNLEVKLYMGTPTIFMISTSHAVFFNPYTFYSKAYESLCFLADSKTMIYESYYHNHYLAAWNDRKLSVSLKKDIKLATEQLTKLIQGKNQHNEDLIPDKGSKDELLAKLNDPSLS